MNASQILVADSWKSVHRDARVGLLALSGAMNPDRHGALDAPKREIEDALRARFAGKSKADLAALDTIRAYTAFYKPFNKTYHVLLQLESVALKGKPLSSATALVQAMFMAEVEHQLLTAGHDLEKVVPPVTIAASRGDETYTRINGSVQTLKANDMCMYDAEGILSSVIYGPDRRTQITGETRRVLYVTYAPGGIAGELLRTHLDRLEQYVRLVSPGVARELSGVWGE
jgi:DNA/RNA-binding domain of Phe-tRNA-synthetase-like protein